MKNILIFTILILIGCSSQKRMVEAPKPMSTVDLTEAEAVYLEPLMSVEPEALLLNTIESRGEGIGMGSIGTIGHGAGNMMIAEPEVQIINVSNNRSSIQTLNQGHVVYKIPTDMKVRNTYQVVVRISKSNVNVFENLNGVIRTSTIPLTETMEVKLIDPSPEDSKMFDIVENNRGEQIIEFDETYTQWSWDITPLKKGNSKLKVVVSIVRNGSVKETVYEDEVKVHMDLGKQIPFFFGKYWQWLLSTLVIPFGIWLYNKKRKKDEQK